MWSLYASVSNSDVIIGVASKIIARQASSRSVFMSAKSLRLESIPEYDDNASLFVNISLRHKNKL